MRYAKLIDGVLYMAPRKIKHDDSITYNPPAEMLIELGYKPLNETPCPEAPEGYHYELSYEEIGEEIVYVWTLFKDEPTPEELLEILLGESE